MSNRDTLDHRRPAPPGEGARVRAFAALARRLAPETTDPKLMAMTKSQRAARRSFAEALADAPADARTAVAPRA